ncbi:MAG: RagB/SusD family nutrient uptake outer membrane protein, partial [Cyclobacteriaceae bacterium]|nr:RagB/SusD family nutrient uptake outer membrane protein [Cyclobacteriaceae bacterium]
MKKISLLFITTILFSTACVNDLDVIPIDPNKNTTVNLYQDTGAYKQLIAKLYGGLALTGQEGPAGKGDIAGIDEGFSSYLRQYFTHQELTTEEV